MPESLGGLGKIGVAFGDAFRALCGLEVNRKRKAGGKEQDVMYYEAKEEHRTVDSLVLPDLKVTDPSTPEFAGRVKVVKELLEHHIEEEETEMFPQAKKLLGKTTLDELGAQMETLKAQLKKELSASNMAA